jgi:hypothetical protein
MERLTLFQQSLGHICQAKVIVSICSLRAKALQAAGYRNLAAFGQGCGFWAAMG